MNNFFSIVIDSFALNSLISKLFLSVPIKTLSFPETINSVSVL